jgi:hypothetical protein
MWAASSDPLEEIERVCREACEIGFLVVEFDRNVSGAPIPWQHLEPWTRARAVTVADVRCDLEIPALEVAVCCDLVYLRDGIGLRLPEVGGAPPAGLLWACSRAGRRGLDRMLLVGGALTGPDTVDLGLARQVVEEDAELPLPDRPSIAALTCARDLMRSSAAGTAGLALELATFRLLFAAGQPNEGARAFLEKREPDFEAT